MKKLSLIAIILASLIFAFSSCTEKENNPSVEENPFKEKLLGQWETICDTSIYYDWDGEYIEQVDYNIGQTYKFLPNDSCLFCFYPDSIAPHNSFYVRYELSGDSLHLFHKTIWYHIDELTDNKLILTHRYQTDYTYIELRKMEDLDSEK